MQIWTDIRTVSELKAFQIAYAELSSDEKQVILTEMIIKLNEYQESVTINGEEQMSLRLVRKENRARRRGRKRFL